MFSLRSGFEQAKLQRQRVGGLSIRDDAPILCDIAGTELAEEFLILPSVLGSGFDLSNNRPEG
jgi:hypothetical protein